MKYSTIRHIRRYLHTIAQLLTVIAMEFAILFSLLI